MGAPPTNSITLPWKCIAIHHQCLKSWNALANGTINVSSVYGLSEWRRWLTTSFSIVVTMNNQCEQCAQNLNKITHCPFWEPKIHNQDQADWRYKRSYMQAAQGREININLEHWETRWDFTCTFPIGQNKSPLSANRTANEGAQIGINLATGLFDRLHRQKAVNSNNYCFQTASYISRPLVSHCRTRSKIFLHNVLGVAF